MYAASQGHLECLRELIGRGADLNGAGGPVHRAACLGRTACLAALIEAGADVRRADGEGNTALMEAARNGHLDASRLLVRAGADTEARN